MRDAPTPQETRSRGSHFLPAACGYTAFTNIFDLVAHDWHTIPDTAIGGGSLLRAGWHPGVVTWSFETTESLVPPVTWTEYPAGGTSAEIPLDGEEPQRYFRLRRP